ncbi:gas vesicle protein [Halochromatium glycolicum]|uniref:Gas vesicle protein n=1 Tax=Halochromatium glycolicum TaxID=85075 RepID=A0AAJ0U7P9_9GAMM|nr:gas vesicle protein [Halochromatium glycolicum]MBK1706854.1 gas vesicle protein [Halochromatium glycolicum]
MANHHRNLSHSTDSTTVADLLERLLDKGVVIAGDIRVKLVEVELLTIEVRLLVCSVDRAVEMGVDWWRGNPAFDSSVRGPSQSAALEERLERLEEKIETALTAKL